MPDFVRFEDGLVVEEITFNGTLKSVGGRKGGRFPIEWMVRHGFVPFERPVVVENYEEINGIIPVEDKGSIVSATKGTARKSYESIRAKILRDIDNRAAQLIERNNRSSGKSSGKSVFNDVVVNKHKEITADLESTTDINLCLFDSESIWDGIEDFDNPGVDVGIWARLMYSMFGG